MHQKPGPEGNIWKGVAIAAPFGILCWYFIIKTMMWYWEKLT